MAGSSSVRGDQTIYHTDNMCFDGTDRGSPMSTNGQLWIGATASNRADNGGHVRLGQITSPGGTVTVGYNAPNITLEVAGGAAVTSVSTANATPQFVLAGSTETVDFAITNLVLGSSLPVLTSGTANVGIGPTVMGTLTSGSNNVGIGNLALQAITTATSNVVVGFGAGRFLTTGSANTLIGTSSGAALNTGASNTAVGQGSLALFTSGAANAGSNTAVGQGALAALVTGVENTALGEGAGAAHTTSDSSNIDIKNAGVAGESNTIRIGTQGAGAGQQNRAFVAGVTGVTVAASSPTAVDTNGQLSDLGFGTVGQTLSSSGAGVSPTWKANFSGSVSAIGGVNPVDSTTYYLGTGQTFIAVTLSTSTSTRFYAPYACVIDKVVGAFAVSGTLGSNEPCTLFIRKNNTTNTNVSTSITLDAVAVPVSVTGLGISLAAGDYISFGFTGPAWGTNPLGVGAAFTFST